MAARSQAGPPPTLYIPQPCPSCSHLRASTLPRGAGGRSPAPKPCCTPTTCSRPVIPSGNCPPQSHGRCALLTPYPHMIFLNKGKKRNGPDLWASSCRRRPGSPAALRAGPSLQPRPHLRTGWPGEGSARVWNHGLRTQMSLPSPCPLSSARTSGLPIGGPQGALPERTLTTPCRLCPLGPGAGLAHSRSLGHAIQRR